MSKIAKLAFFKRKEAPQVHTYQPPQTKEVEPRDTIESLIVSSKVLCSEILWALNVVKCHFSLRSCMGLNELFKVMFKDSDIAKDFKLGKTKCTYLINFGLALYLKQEHLNSIKASSHFVVSVDESLNRVVQDDQMDIQIHFWNNSENVVSTRYLDSRFLKRPNAENLVTELKDSLSELCFKNMIQLSMEGPKTNWKVLELLNDQCVESEIDFVDSTFKKLGKRHAKSLREDFCGTTNTSCEWIKRRKTNTALSIDLDEEVLEWGKIHKMT